MKIRFSRFKIIVFITLFIFSIIGYSVLYSNKDSISRPHYDFIVVGDSEGPGPLAPFIKATRSLDTNTIVAVGDIFQPATPKTFAKLDRIFKKYLRSDISFIPVIGNHDVEEGHLNTDAGRERFNAYFGIPTASMGYRFIDRDQYCFVVLNTYLRGYENRLDPDQLQWLKNTLDITYQETPTKPVFILMHHIVHYVGHHPHLKNADEFKSIIHAYPNVRAVFQGHEHLYHHMSATTLNHTINYYITGGAANNLYTETKGIGIHHMLGVQVNPTFNVVLLDKKGRVITNPKETWFTRMFR